MFDKGQKVVCIKGTTSACGIKLIEQKIYVVKNIWKCNCSNVLDVGIKISTNVTCFKCNKLLSTDGTWWLYASRFVPLDEWENATENVNRLLEEIQEPVFI